MKINNKTKQSSTKSRGSKEGKSKGTPINKITKDFIEDKPEIIKPKKKKKGTLKEGFKIGEKYIHPYWGIYEMDFKTPVRFPNMGGKGVECIYKGDIEGGFDRKMFGLLYFTYHIIEIGGKDFIGFTLIKNA